jgi:hypothetical protein
MGLDGLRILPIQTADFTFKTPVVLPRPTAVLLRIITIRPNTLICMGTGIPITTPAVTRTVPAGPDSMVDLATAVAVAIPVAEAVAVVAGIELY